MEPNARSTYARLVTDRDSYVREAYESALLTIPALMPEAVDALNRTVHTGLVLPKPWQSLGARGVNNLAAKLLLALLPPTGAFFRYVVDNRAWATLPPERAAAVKTDIQARLAARERIVTDAVNVSSIRTKSFAAFKHLIATGNYLMYFPPGGGAKGFPLNQYVVRRDFLGNVLELIYVEILDRDTVEPEILALLMEHEADKFLADAQDADKGPRRTAKTVAVYTRVCRDGKRFNFQQEVCDRVVPGKSGSVKVEDSPWLVLRWTAIDGEDYGRGFVEEYRGDLRALEELSKALNKAALNAAKLVPLISPQAMITPRQLVEAENGEPIVANHDDVLFLQQQKAVDMQVAAARADHIERNLASDFLMTSSIQRQAERVTAEEIRLMAQELEDTLGGVYSIQAQEFQLPLARRIEAQLIRSGSLEKLPGNVTNVQVVTGLAAIGRGQDVQRLREGIGILSEMATALGPQAAQQITSRINPDDLLKRVFTGVGLDTDGLFKSDEQMAAEAQAAEAATQREQLLELAKSGTGAQAVQQIGQARAQQNAAQPGQPQQ